jgi:glycosyltransferase involved in cell wall biosynthesis
MIRLSVVVCTHNRAPMLRRALESLSAQTLDPASYEVIVVDNASTDATAQVVRDCATPFELRYVREERLGLSRARNAGAAVASAPYVAYLDDDARAESQWLEALLHAFESVVPAPGAVGGRVWLDWEGLPPSWLPQRYWSLYTYVDHGEAGHCLTAGEYLVGANIAFRADVLREQGGFDTRLGRRGTSLLSGEEAALLGRLREQDVPIYYEPKAIVWHAVAQARRRRRWFWARLFWDGATQPLLDHGAARSPNFYAAQTYHDLRRMAFFSYRWLQALIQGNPEQRLDSALALVQRMGRLRTHCLLAWGSLRSSSVV